MSNQAEAGKGSAPRKAQDQNAYADNWDRIFGKKVKEEQPPGSMTDPDVSTKAFEAAYMKTKSSQRLRDSEAALQALTDE